MLRMATGSEHIAYITTAEEIRSIGGLGICDECNKAADHGFLIPVLNHWQCIECFCEWQKYAKYYPEDDDAELRQAAYYESRIPVENDE